MSSQIADRTLGNVVFLALHFSLRCVASFVSRASITGGSVAVGYVLHTWVLFESKVWCDQVNLHKRSMWGCLCVSAPHPEYIQRTRKWDFTLYQHRQAPAILSLAKEFPYLLAETVWTFWGTEKIVHLPGIEPRGPCLSFCIDSFMGLPRRMFVWAVNKLTGLEF
jgi:hypothetical protein